VVCAVDIYAIISGYVGYKENEYGIKTSKYINLWLQVFFYSVGITVVALFVFPDKVGTESLIRSLFPVLSERYWYFSSYTVVFFLAPWVNRLIYSLDQKQLTKFVVLLFSVFSVITIITYNFEKDPFSLEKGYSAIWLMTLYIVGAWIKKNKIFALLNKAKLFLLLIGSYVATCLLKFTIPALYGIVSYTSPTVVITAVFFVVLFSKFNFPVFINKVIAFLAPASFGVYLIHVQPFIYNNVIKDAFLWIGESSFVLIPFEVIVCALIIMATCLAIEKVRLLLFRVLGVNRFASFVGIKIDDMIDGIFELDRFAISKK